MTMPEISNMANSILGNLETILRHIAPGYVAIICVRILYPEYLSFATTKEIYFMVAPLLGFFLYFVHTCFIYRFILFFTTIFVVILNKLEKSSWKCLEQIDRLADDDSYRLPRLFIIPKQIHLLDTQRWRRRGSGVSEVKSVQKELDKWYAMINFLFCSSYAMILIPLWFRYKEKIPLCSNQKLSVWIGSILLLLAFITDIRAVNKQFWACKTYPNRKLPYTNCILFNCCAVHKESGKQI